MASIPDNDDNRAIFFFDIDNCLYAKNHGVQEHMDSSIAKFVLKHLNISPEAVTCLRKRYSQEFGLTIGGLRHFHNIDPIEFNREVDDALPLDELLHPELETRRILESFDPAKVKLWLFTNAHITHGRRVVELLGIADLFEGITYCDYSQQELVPKPFAEMFAKAEREAGTTERTTIYFVDDSDINCRAAFARGWTNTVHLMEQVSAKMSEEPIYHRVRHLRELLDLFPELLKVSPDST